MGRQRITKQVGKMRAAYRRETKWKLLSFEEQLAALDKRLGSSVDHAGRVIGNGAKKQRARIQREIKERDAAADVQLHVTSVL